MTTQSQGTLTVLPDLTFAERIARSNHNGTNPRLTKHKLVVTPHQFGEWDWQLFDFDRTFHFVGILRAMREEGFQAAQTGHFLAFAETYSPEQHECRVVGMNINPDPEVACNIPCHVLLLSAQDKRTWLLRFWFDEGEDTRKFRFLGVRPKQ